MDATYQLILIGQTHSLQHEIKDVFLKRVEELGLSKEMVSFLDIRNFSSVYKRNCPSVCLYFGGDPNSNLELIEQLQHDAVFIIPVVSDLKSFANSIPEKLQAINGFALKSEQNIDSLVNNIMEGLSLLRQSRRLFISYRRVESRTIAIQLYEHLDACGFDVFLDTHSIRPGEPFQDELWHRLVDTDVVVLINTPGFFESRWTTEELAKASAMSIGVIQLIYPDHTPETTASLCFPFYLEESHFAGKDFKNPNAFFTVDALKEVAQKIESVRARSLAARQDNIIQEFTTTANNLKIEANLQPEKFILMKNKQGKELAVIPTVGVPHAFTYNQTEELVKRIRQANIPEALLVYDHRNIREKWLNHLVWLDLYLPVKTVRITEIEEWLNKQ